MFFLLLHIYIYIIYVYNLLIQIQSNNFGDHLKKEQKKNFVPRGSGEILSLRYLGKVYREDPRHRTSEDV